MAYFLQALKRPKKKGGEKPNETKKVVRVWIYDTIYFNAFYEKHSRGEGTGEFTLLVDKNGNQLSLQQAREAVERHILKITNIKQYTAPVAIEGLRVCSFHREAGMTSQLRKGFFVFEGIEEITQRTLSQLKDRGAITLREYTEIIVLLANARRLEYEYSVASLVFIRHIHVR